MSRLKLIFSFSRTLLTTFAGILAVVFILVKSNENALYSQAGRYLGQKIEAIDFKGNINVSSVSLYGKISMKVGSILTLRMLNDDLKTIMDDGSFSNVTIKGEPYKEGVRIIFVLEEKPKIADIKFKGMHALQETEISDVLPLQEGETYSEQLAARSVQMIASRYREEGLFNASVKVTTKQKRKKENQLVVYFLIDEGEEMKVSKINLVGVHALDPEKILSALELEEDGFIADGKFQEHLFDQDRETIIGLYRSKGYLDAELIKADWDVRWKNPKKKDKRVIVVTYKVHEGGQYYFNGYSMEWDDRFLNSETHKPLFTQKEIEYYFEYTDHSVGDVLNDSRYMKDRSYINYMYSQKGYILTRVIPDRTDIELTEEAIEEKAKTREQIESEENGEDFYNLKELRKILESKPEMRGKKFVHYHFRIAEGDKGYIENIIIKGNKKTLDKVIRREVLIKEGDLFNSDLVQRSREKIYNLGFFKQVNVDYRPGSREGLMNLIIDVEEQPTGTISLGGGYSTTSGFSIFSEVSENNLNGTGQRISGRVEFGPYRTLLSGSWTEPWMFNTPWSLTLGASYLHSRILVSSLADLDTDETAYYYKDTLGYSIGVGHRIGTNWGHYHRYSPEYSRATSPSSLVPDSIFRLVDLGWQVKNRVTNGIYYDDRDNYFSTTEGMYGNLYMDVVGSVLSGDDHYNRYYFTGQYYWWPMDFTFFNKIRYNVLRRWRIVFEHRGGMVFTQLTNPVYQDQDPEENPYIEYEDRLFLGGYETLRGWDYYDSLYPLAWQDGGAHRLTYGTELRLPVEPSLLWLVFFFDAGALYTDPNQYVLNDFTDSYQQSIYDSRLSEKTLALDYFRYSWGFGFRLQIPIMPLRIYLAKRLLWDRDSGGFYEHPDQQGFEFVFGIGDTRF